MVKKDSVLFFHLVLVLIKILGILILCISQAIPLAAGSSNTTTGTATATVLQDTVPIAVCQDLIVQLDELGTVSISAEQIDGGSTDDWGIATMTVSPDNFSCSEVGDNTVLLVVVDGSGNTASCTATVTVEDSHPPVAVCEDIVIRIDETGLVRITADQVDGGSSDDCEIAAMIVSPDSFSCPNIFTCPYIGNNEVVLTVVDVGGNSTQCTSVVTIEPGLSPIKFIDELIEYILSLNIGNVKKSLIAKLNNIKKILEKYQDREIPDHILNQIERKINAFINEVEALRGKKLTDEQADILINAARDLIELIHLIKSFSRPLDGRRRRHW